MASINKLSFDAITVVVQLAKNKHWVPYSQICLERFYTSKVKRNMFESRNKTKLCFVNDQTLYLDTITLLF